MNAPMNSIDAVMQALQAQNYIAERGLATAIFLALKLKKPLFLEGEVARGRHAQGKASTQCRADVEPHARNPRRAQTALPLLLDRLPLARKRADDRAVEGARSR